MSVMSSWTFGSGSGLVTVERVSGRGCESWKSSSGGSSDSILSAMFMSEVMLSWIEGDGTSGSSESTDVTSRSVGSLYSSCASMAVVRGEDLR